MGVGRHIADKHSCQSGVGTQNSQKVTKVQDDDGKNQIFEIFFQTEKRQASLQHFQWA